VITNGNAFSTIEVMPLLDDPRFTVAGVVLMQVPPGHRGSLRRLLHLARRTGARYTGYKALCQLFPRISSAVSRRPALLADICRRAGIPVLAVSNVNERSTVNFVTRLEPDVLLSASCPQIMGAPLLAAAPIGINVHQALLPAYGGIAPYFWALHRAEEGTGVTIHILAPQVDAGPILRQEEIDVRPRDTALGLQLRLVRAASRALPEVLSDLPAALADARAQEPMDRTFFDWPSPADVSALRRQGHRLARWRDYLEMIRALRASEVLVAGRAHRQDVSYGGRDGS